MSVSAENYRTDKYRAAKRKYYAEHADRMRECARLRTANPKFKALKRAYYDKNKPRIAAYQAKRHAERMRDDPEYIARRRAYSVKYEADPQHKARKRARSAANSILPETIARRRELSGLPKPTRPEPSLCECCGGPTNGRSPRLHLDHDHVTGAFRGWLCSNCNVGIGKLGDDVSGVLRAVDYLRLYESAINATPGGK